jgi:hypothetical protein
LRPREDNDGKIKTILTSDFGLHVYNVLDKVNDKDEVNKRVNGTNIPHVGLFYSLSQDDTIFSRSGVNGCPVIMELKNFSEEPVLLGLQPVNPLTKSIRDNIQSKMGCTHKGMQQELNRSLDKYIRFEYIRQCVEDIRPLQKDGVLLQIGKNPNDLVIAHPIICLLTGDSKELNSLCSVNSQMNGCKCRICTETNCIRFTDQGKTWVERKDKEMMNLCVGLDNIEKYIHQKFVDDNGTAKKKKKEWFSESMQDTIAKGKALNCLPTSNTIFWELGFDVSKIWGLPNFGLHNMGSVDMLHTFLKGILENGICWIFSCLYLLQQINPDKYRNIVSNMDSIYHNFPHLHSVVPVRLHYKEYGISKILTEGKSRKQSASAGTGTGVGGTPAAHLDGIAFMLLHAIGRSGGAALPQSGSQIPDTIELPKGRQDNPNKWGPRKQYKVRTMMVNALQAILNALTFTRKKDGFSKDDLIELENLLRLARAHQIQIFSLKSDLKQMKKGILIKQRTDTMFKGFKHHLLEHLPLFIRLFGSPEFFDTQISEHNHVFIKGLYRKTTRRLETSTREMFERMSRIRRIHFMIQAFNITSVTPHHHDQDPVSKHRGKILQLKHLQSFITMAIDRVETKFQKQTISKMTSLAKIENVKRLLKQQYDNRQRQNGGDLDFVEDQRLHDIIALNTNLETNRDSLYGTFFIPSNTSKIEMALQPGSFSSSDPDLGTFVLNTKAHKYLHPFVEFNQLYIHLNRKTPEGLSKIYFENHKVNPTRYKIKLNEMLSSRGAPELGIDPFTVHCNKDKNNFSAVEVSYQDAIHVVRVFAIVTFHKRNLFSLDQDENVRIVLVVGRLRNFNTSTRRLDSIHCPMLQYDLQTRTNQLEVDVIDITSIIRPCCLMPIFDSNFRPNYKEVRNDLIPNSRHPTFVGHRLFYHVRIPTMIYFKVMNYKVIDEVIDRIVVPRVLSNSTTETPTQTKERKELERNYIALHLFLNNDELILTENANNVNVDHNIQHDTNFRDEFWDSDMFEQVDGDEDDGDEDEIVLVS